MDIIAIAVAKGQATAEAQKQAQVAKNYANAASAAAEESNATEVRVKVLAETAAKAAQQAAGYAGAATYALGPDENGLFSFFMNEEEQNYATHFPSRNRGDVAESRCRAGSRQQPESG